MIAKVVVAVSYANVKRDPSVKFLQIRILNVLLVFINSPSGSFLKRKPPIREKSSMPVRNILYPGIIVQVTAQEYISMLLQPLVAERERITIRSAQ